MTSPAVGVVVGARRARLHGARRAQFVQLAHQFALHCLASAAPSISCLLHATTTLGQLVRVGCSTSPRRRDARPPVACCAVHVTLSTTSTTTPAIGKNCACKYAKRPWPGRSTSRRTGPPSPRATTRRRSLSLTSHSLLLTPSTNRCNSAVLPAPHSPTNSTALRFAPLRRFVAAPTSQLPLVIVATQCLRHTIKPMIATIPIIIARIVRNEELIDQCRKFHSIASCHCHNQRTRRHHCHIAVASSVVFHYIALVTCHLSIATACRLALLDPSRSGSRCRPRRRRQT
jgi:hypothetical protein